MDAPGDARAEEGAKEPHARAGALGRRWAASLITATFTEAPGNDAPIGGLKVETENGWFVARPSGTEAIYKIYAESFRGEDHLQSLLDEAQAIVGAAFEAAEAVG